jgi:Sulfotransferase family
VTSLAGAVTARARRGGNRTLGAVESAVLRTPSRPLSSPPILIVGAPRCGSTLLSQLMIGCLDVSYLSNLHCALFGSPALAEYLVRRRPRPAMVYESRHGSTSGLLAPSECGQFWYRFFRKAPQPVPPAEADPRSLRGLRTSVAAFQAAARRPVVFKNLICSLRVAAIAAALPEALFIVVHRDLMDNARSLLVARRSVTGSYERWWSAEPPGYETLLGLTPEQQVVGQVRGVEAAIDGDRDAVGRDHFLDVSYEDMCADPATVLEAVTGFAAAHGCTLRRVADPPSAFTPPHRANVDPDLDARLERAAAAT